jgi:hypothetical protein
MGNIFMGTDRKNLQEKDFYILILILGVVLGAILRFVPPTLAGFPVHDGGMFYYMVEELISNHFALPAFTTYNLSDIPFAYPPFGFYFTALISTLFRVPVLDVVRWLPPLISIFALLAFYPMADEILGSKRQAALATLFYGLLPASFEWTVMGGGITRAFGLLFMLLTITFANRLFARKDYLTASLTAVFGALAFLSHPQSGLQAALVSILVWLFRGRSKRTFLMSVFVSLGVITLTSPWWGTVLSLHGLAPFSSVSRISNDGSLYLVKLLLLWIENGPVVTLIAAIGITGLLAALANKKFLLPIWLVLPFFVDPRTANDMGRLIAPSMLAGYGFDSILAPALMVLRKRIGEWFSDRFVSFSLFTIVFVLFFGSSIFSFNLAEKSLSIEDRGTITWVEQNIPPGNEFLLLTGEQYSMNDPFQEWFPALTNQRSQTTLQGGEWTRGEDFFPFYGELLTLQNCASLECMNAWTERTGLRYQYLVIKKVPKEKSLYRSLTSLLEIVRNSPEYKPLFEDENAVIFFASEQKQ